MDRFAVWSGLPEEKKDCSFVAYGMFVQKERGGGNGGGSQQFSFVD